MEPGYRILEHPADLGIESWGATFPEALSMAVSGLASILVDPATVEPAERRAFSVSGNGSETLVVKVLSEVLFLFDAEQFVPKSLTVNEESTTRLRGFVDGEPLKVGKHRMRLDVKAITYHQLSVQRQSGGVSIIVYLDI
jgi:SHS2 domain-containing protein